MISTKRLLPLFAVTLLGLPPVRAQQPDRLTVLTYNIQIGIGMDKKTDLERTAAVIKSVNPDIVALQEVDRKARRSGGFDQAIELAKATGMQMVFGKASVREGIDEDGGDYGVAILSRFPIRRSLNHRLPFTRGFELRTALEVEFDWPLKSGKRIPVRFFSTHFDNGSEPDRIASAQLVNRLAVAGGDIPTILAGDLNAQPGSRPLEILKEEWTFAGAEKAMLTFPANAPRFLIDYVLLRPAQTWKVIEASVVEAPDASDHRPVKAVLEYIPSQTH